MFWSASSAAIPELQAPKLGFRFRVCVQRCYFGNHDEAQNQIHPYFVRRGAFEVFTGHWPRLGTSCRNGGALLWRFGEFRSFRLFAGVGDYLGGSDPADV